MGIAAIGSNLFVLRSIVRVIKYEDVVRGSLIFFIPLLLGILTLIFSLHRLSPAQARSLRETSTEKARSSLRFSLAIPVGSACFARILPFGSFSDIISALASARYSGPQV